MQNTFDLTHLSDAQLLIDLGTAVRTSKEQIAWVVAHLAEMDRRRLYLRSVSPSLFQYAVDILGMSESEAYLRICAARTAQEYPVVFEMIASGALHLSAIKLVRPYLTAASHMELLALVSHKSKRKVELELARRFPEADVPQVIRRLPERGGEQATALPMSLAAGEPSVAAQSSPSPTADALPTRPAPRAAPAPAAATPLSARRYKVQFTVSSEVHDKLRAAQDLLRHQVPDGDLNAVLSHALDALIAKKMKAKCAALGREAPERSSLENESAGHNEVRDERSLAGPAPRKRRTRYIRRAVKRAVFARDGLRCTHIDEHGQRCTVTGGLELHHMVPFGKGGLHTVDNIRVICKGHNALAAELDYGATGVAARYRRRGSPPPAAGAAPAAPAGSGPS